MRLHRARHVHDVGLGGSEAHSGCRHPRVVAALQEGTQVPRTAQQLVGGGAAHLQHAGLQPAARWVAARRARGCSLRRAGLQPEARGVHTALISGP